MIVPVYFLVSRQRQNIFNPKVLVKRSLLRLYSPENSIALWLENHIIYKLMQTLLWLFTNVVKSTKNQKSPGYKIR